MPASAHARAGGIIADAAGSGYWILTSDGQVHPFGRAPVLDSVRRSRLGHDRVVAAAAPSASVGYELEGAFGKLHSFDLARRAHLPSSVPLQTAVAGLERVRGTCGFFVVSFPCAVASIGSAQPIAPVTGLSSVRSASASV